MAQIAFAEIGAAVGTRLLPAGLNVAGRAISGAAIGRAAGAMAGRALSNYLAGPAEGPRIKALHVMEASEGVGVPSVYGRMRVSGQLIWAARFRERRTTRSVGGKGGPKVNEYSYSVSFAVAIGEGPGVRVVRAWANGEAFDLSGTVHRLYDGSEGQLPDPLIEMIEGAAPAYRGTAYIVFEDLPLDAFGNRLPQLSFEIVRVPPGDAEPGLRESVMGVNIIPASGEFVYATEIVREQFAPGRERAINANSGEARADFLVSLDQMREGLPRVSHVALTVGWFGSSVAAGDCVIRPGVETRARVTVPQTWHVAGEGRGEAYLISRDAAGNANYGGTPSDASVVQAIRELKERGYAVTLTPFLMMDAPGFPWRGRIGVAEDGTAGARAEIEAFVNGAEGYRRFILHHAALAAEAGGVEAFLVGSEMRGLTRVRDAGGAGAFPFVEALCALAAEVKALLPGAKVSYAADWTEYGAFVPGDGNGDVLFPLDALWAHGAVDFVGIDWYPPLGDWRAGAGHLDALAGYAAADDPDYLASQIEGGEGFDWYYADEAARASQVRTPINDTAHGEDWIFRVKDLSGWHDNLHYPRTEGVRAGAPTGWTPGMKPVRLSEIGFAAVDKGGNAPNVFYDPKSSESALPPFSTGERDDVFQKRALGVALAHFETSEIVEAALVWAWDARPYPAWPMRGDIWGDGDNWARGHWLNGREGLTTLAAVVGDICARGGVAADVRGLDGVIEGYGLDGVHSVRAALEPLKAAFGFEVVERPEGLVFHMGDGAAVDLSAAVLVEPGLVATRQMMDKAPERLRLAYIDPDRDYQPGIAEARRGGGDARLVSDVALPLVLSAGRAEAVAGALLAAAAREGTAEIALPLAGLAIEPGDTLRVDGGPLWRVVEAREEGARRGLALVRDTARVIPARDGGTAAAPTPAPVFSGIDLVVIDAPSLPGTTEAGPLVAAYASPWPGEVAVLAGPAADSLSERARLVRPAVIGRLVAPVGAGPVGRWDRANAIEVEAPGGEFASVSAAAVLAGGNGALLETAAGWELVQFQSAELVGAERWRLSGLLRGQGGRPSGAAETGARLVLLDDAVARASVSGLEAGLALLWRAAGWGEAAEAVFEDRAGLPWRPVRLAAPPGTVRWARRGRDVPHNWDLPDPARAVAFAVEADFGAGFGGRAETALAEAAWPVGALALRIAEIGTDGRIGEWLSIPAGSSYL